MPKPRSRLTSCAVLLACAAGCQGSKPAEKGDGLVEPELVTQCFYFADIGSPIEVSVGKHDRANYTVRDQRLIAVACQTLKVYRNPNGGHYVEGADGAIHGSTFSLKPGEEIWCGSDPSRDCRK